MRNSLLTTTALATLLFSSTARSDEALRDTTHYKVTLGGVIDAQSAFGFNNSGVTTFGTTNNSTIALSTSTAVNLKATAKTARGMLYGANVGLRPTVASKTNVNYFSMNKTYIFVESGDLGRVEVGSNDSAGDTMTRGAGSIAAATGGVEGDFFRYANADNMFQGVVITLPRLSLENPTFGSNSIEFYFGSEKARKITYLSPKLSGVQLGVSYIPDVSNIGILPNPKLGTGGIKNAVSGGLMWTGKVKQNHYFETSVTGEWGKSTNDRINNTKAIIVGGVWKYKDFKTAGSFGWLDSIDIAKSATPKMSWFATLGAGMDLDKLYGSVTGMYGSRNDNPSWLLSLGLDYKLAPGFLPYIEATYCNLETKASGAIYYPRLLENYGTAVAAIASKSSQTVLILGVKVKF